MRFPKVCYLEGCVPPWKEGMLVSTIERLSIGWPIDIRQPDYDAVEMLAGGLCRFTGVTDLTLYGFSFVAPSPRSYLLSSLTSLTLRHIESPALNKLLRAMHMPNVRRLLVDFAAGGGKETIITSCLSEVFPLLNDLTLVGCFTMSVEGWVDILPQHDGLQRLKCECTTLGDEVLRLLRTKGESEGAWLAPKLLRLEMVDCDVTTAGVDALREGRGQGLFGLPPLELVHELNRIWIVD